MTEVLLSERDVAAPGTSAARTSGRSPERGAQGVGSRWKQTTASLFPRGSLCTPRPHPSSSGTARGRKGQARGSGPPSSFSPANSCTNHFFFSHGRGFSGEEGDRQKAGALAPLCYDASTPCSIAAPSPVSTAVPPPRISCPHRGQPPRPHGPGGAGEALPAGDDSELLFTYLAAALPAGLLPVRLPESRALPRSRSLLLRPHTPSPSATPVPRRPSACPPGSHADGSVT